MAIWVRVAPEVAQADRLYGLRGWLRLPSAVIALSVLMSPLALFVGLVAPAGPDALAILLGDLDMLLSVGGSLVLGVLWFRLWPGFRIGAAWLILVETVIAIAGILWLALVGPVPALHLIELDESIAGSLLELLLNLGFLACLQGSRRFRVTFEHRVRATAISPQPASHSPAPPPAPSY